MAVQLARISMVGTGLAPAQRNQATMDKALLEKKYWDDLLEKLRKSGGGGGGSDPRFDRIAVSMQLSNFLSNKQIRAIFNNFTKEFLNVTNDILKYLKNNKNVFVSKLQHIGKMFLNGLQNIFLLIVRRDAPVGRLYRNAKNIISAFAGILSFQLNKLKEILEEDLKRMIKKIKSLISDFFDYILTNLKKN